MRVHLTTSPAVPCLCYPVPQKDTTIICTHHARIMYISREDVLFMNPHPIPVIGVCPLHQLTCPLMDACYRPMKELILDITPHTHILQPAFFCESEVPSPRPLSVSTARRGRFLRASGMAVSVLLGQELAGEPGDCLAVSRCWPLHLNGSSPPAPPPMVATSKCPKSS